MVDSIRAAAGSRREDCWTVSKDVYDLVNSVRLLNESLSRRLERSIVSGPITPVQMDMEQYDSKEDMPLNVSEWYEANRLVGMVDAKLKDFDERGQLRFRETTLDDMTRIKGMVSNVVRSGSLDSKEFSRKLLKFTREMELDIMDTFLNAVYFGYCTSRRD